VKGNNETPVSHCLPVTQGLLWKKRTKRKSSLAVVLRAKRHTEQTEREEKETAFSNITVETFREIVKNVCVSVELRANQCSLTRGCFS
jgi:hypothetical protein